jgi:hypothetical protein
MPPRKAATAASAHTEGDRRRVDLAGQQIGRNATQRDLKKQRRRRGKVNADLRSSIPNANSANAIAIYDGADHVGDCVERDGAHHLFSPSGKWLGAFPSRQAAMRAAPKRGRA